MPEDFELASVYTKNGLPDKRIVKAFRVNEKMILKLRHGAAVDGRYMGDAVSDESEINSELVSFARKKRYNLLFVLQNLIWRIPVWKSGVKAFAEDYSPDIIFTVFSNNIYLNRIILPIIHIISIVIK